MPDTTWSFLLDLFMPIIVYFIAVISCIIAIKSIKKNRHYEDEDKNGNKYNIFIAVATLCGFIVALYTALRIEIQNPEIHVVKNESKNYNDEYMEIEIKNVPIFDNYYTIDSSDPENGIEYIDPFIVEKSKVILAKSKFLWCWSSESQFTYPPENLSNNVIQPIEIDNNVEPNEIDNETETQIKDEEPTETENQSKETEQQDTQSDNSETETKMNSNDEPSTHQTTEPSTPNSGLNASEGSALMTYINQYRTQSGIGELTWNSDLEQIAQNMATSFATGGTPVGDMSYIVIGRQCNGAKNAQKAVSDWITGNAYIPSEADSLLNAGYTQIGGALYYLPDGNEYGYHYFWIVCLR